MNTIQTLKAINWLALNWIDYTILAIILLSLLIGVVRGFISEIISLVTWVAAFYLAFRYSKILAEHLTFIHSASGSYAAAFAIIFILTLIVGISLNACVRHLWLRTGVPGVDRFLGLLLGIVRGIFIVAFIILFIRSSPLKDESKVKEAQFIPLFNPIVSWLQSILPEKVVNVSEWSKTKTNTESDNKSNSSVGITRRTQN